MGWKDYLPNILCPPSRGNYVGWAHHSVLLLLFSFFSFFATSKSLVHSSPNFSHVFSVDPDLQIRSEIWGSTPKTSNFLCDFRLLCDLIANICGTQQDVKWWMALQTAITRLNNNGVHVSACTEEQFSPIGTWLSYTRSPTLDQSPIGSRFTPRLMRAYTVPQTQVISVAKKIQKGIFFLAENSNITSQNTHTQQTITTCARSLRRVFSVFVRIVTGRGIWLASRNFINCNIETQLHNVSHIYTKFGSILFHCSLYSCILSRLFY